MEPALNALGRRLAREQDESTPAFDLERARARLLEAVRPAKSRRARWGWTGAWVAALAVAAWLLLLRRPPLEFQVGLQGNRVRAGEWIAAQGERVPIAFSDGTQLTLAESSRARIVDIHADGASVIVERGRLRASVVKRQRTGWRVFVGPYLVRVTGTQFDVAWQPESEHFSLALREGAVLVTGPGLGQELALHAGQELDLSLRNGLPDLVPPAPTAGAAPPAAVQAAPLPSPPLPVAPDAEPRPEASANGAAVGPARKRDDLRAGSPRSESRDLPNFRELAAASMYREALAAAQRAGFERLCRTAAEDDLVVLADVARLAGDVERARLAYHSLRERFGGASGAHAAFFLGRLAFDHDADYGEAARLFALSMAEQPEGPLAQEAAGRLLEAKLRLADGSGARQVARHYLEQYPGGPHRESAEAVLRTP